MRLFTTAVLLTFLMACGNNPEPASQPTDKPISSIVTDSSQWSASDRQFNPLVNAYFDLKDALVEWDTAAADAASVKLRGIGDSLVKDSSIALEIRQHISSIAAEADGLIAETDITEKRRAFHMISQHLMPLLKDVSFKAQPIYQQVCPMAFNDNETAFWLSKDREIMNPYLGRKHPKYASGMLHCGELGDSLFIQP